MKFVFSKVKRQIILIAIVLVLLFCKTQIVYSGPQINLNDSPAIVVEHIRLKVPKKYRKVWLSAEEGSWAKWLAKKNGFLGRQLFWDPRSEEATLLISWSSYEKWKNIPQKEIDLVQKEFEEIAKDMTGQKTEKIFPILYEGQLLPQ